MRTIKLQSAEGENFEVDVEIVKCSGMIKTLLENLGEKDEYVPLPKVSSAILRKIIQWATYHKDDPPPSEDEECEDERRTDDISSWDADFLTVDIDMLIQLANSAHDLDIKGLSVVVCKTFANMIKGKTIAELRNTFNFVNVVNVRHE